MYRIELLGELRIRDGVMILPTGSNRKAASLLALLASRNSQSASRDFLASHLWPGDCDSVALDDRFRQALSGARKLMNDSLKSDSQNVWLAGLAVETDLTDFNKALSVAERSSNPSEKVQYLHQATKLYRGLLMLDFSEPWVLQERREYARRCCEALSQLCSLLLDSNPVEAIQAGEKAIAINNMDEQCYFNVAEAYARIGDRNSISRLRQQLEECLGVEKIIVSNKTQEAFSRLLQRPAPIAAQRHHYPRGEMDRMIAIQMTPGGAESPDSPLYVTRLQDQTMTDAIRRSESFVRIKGPKGTGKSSLLMRGLLFAQERGARTLFTDFQALDSETLTSDRSLIDHLMQEITLELAPDTDPVIYWRSGADPSIVFERFMASQLHVGPFVWAIDNVDRILDSRYRDNFFGMLRKWHNKRASELARVWKNLTIVMAHAAEPRLFIKNVLQSPFNVGVGAELVLDDFGPEEVAVLNQLYDSPISDASEIAGLMDLLGGHPYLIRVALHYMHTNHMSLGEFTTLAARADGPYRHYMAQLLEYLQSHDELYKTIRCILDGGKTVDPDMALCLTGAGILRGSDRSCARFRCRLYQEFLQAHLSPR